MGKLRISDDLSLTIDAATQAIGWLGRRGSGKSYGATKLAELFHGAGVQFVAIDPVEGIAALGSDYEPLPTGEALQVYWLQRLPEGERKILEVLIRRQAFTPQQGVRRGPYKQFALRKALRKLNGMGYDTRRAFAPSVLIQER